jgi:HEAT repeat protein
MSYRDQIAVIGNNDARLAELLRLAMKPGGEALLVEAFWDPYPPLRHRAADTLANVLSDEMARVVGHLATGELPNPSTLAEAKATIPGEITDEVQRTAALALRAKSLPDDVGDLLLRAFKDDDAGVRYHAILALHRNADPDTLRSVARDGLADLDAGVAVVAAQLVAEYGWEDLIGDVLEVYRRVQGTDRLQIAIALSELLEPVDVPEGMVDVLIEGLRDEKTVAASCKALARLRPAKAIAPLRRAMTTKRPLAHPLNKVEAAAALVALGDEEGTRFLERMLEGRRRDTRGYAIELVVELGLEQYRERVEEIARSNDYHADTAVLALKNFGDSRAFDLLHDIARTHPDPEIRELAAETSAVDGSIGE